MSLKCYSDNNKKNYDYLLLTKLLSASKKIKFILSVLYVLIIPLKLSVNEPEEKIKGILMSFYQIKKIRK